MRKMPKGLAITAGIFLILGVLMTLITTLTNQAMQLMQGINLLSYLLPNLLSILTFVLLIVVLFRGKIDTFSGVIFLVVSAVTGFNLLGNIRAVSIYIQLEISLLPQVFAIASNLLRLVLYILMGVHSFRKNAGKTVLFGIGFILVGIVSSAQTVAQYISYDILSVGISAFVMILPGVIGSILGAVPMALTGFAVGHAKATVNPNDPYGLHAQYGMTPPAAQYQAPQYQDPQYQDPQYQAPQYQAPQYQAPQYQAPQYQDPQQNSWQQPQQ